MSRKAGEFQWRKDVQQAVTNGDGGFDPYNSVGKKNARETVELDETVLVEGDTEDEHYWRNVWGLRAI